VFLENLNLVSGIEVGFGGVYIGAAPYFLHVPLDASGDKPAGDRPVCSRTGLAGRIRTKPSIPSSGGQMAGCTAVTGVHAVSGAGVHGSVGTRKRIP
jgi:hypothetical protein